MVPFVGVRDNPVWKRSGGRESFPLRANIPYDAAIGKIYISHHVEFWREDIYIDGNDHTQPSERQ